jgi:DNA helicase II / ATP-dependent DNA helicase PcrA
MINLNEKQKQAVEHKRGALLIIAGAGTGKTAVISQRITHILKSKWAKPDEILALTFTDKAANEMLERVEDDLPLGYGDIWISTFHSFGDRVLKQEGHYIGLDTNYTRMSPAQSYMFFRKNLFDFSLKKFRPYGNPTKFINDILAHFSRLQDEDVTPEEYIKYAKSLSRRGVVQKENYEDTLELATVYDEYTKLKMQNSKIDFGDLILLTIKLLREKPNVLKRYQEKFKYILIDEFQDTNYTQSVLVNILSGLDPKKDFKKIGKVNPNLTVVGDDDQAIYKFRGAAISNILQFKQYYPKAKEVVLVENYRSRQEILDSAYTLIRNNNPHRLEITEKIDKRLLSKTTYKPDDDAVSLVVAENEDAESEWIAKEILDLTGYGDKTVVKKTQKFDNSGQSAFVELVPDRKFKFSDIAILVRAHAHSESVVQNLRYFGIPYKLGGSRGLYFRDEIKVLIAFLRILTDYKDEISMFKLLSMNEWDLCPREYLELNRLAREEKISLLEELESIFSVSVGKEIDFTLSNLGEKILSKEAVEGLEKFLQILNDCIFMVKENTSVGQILYHFIQKSGYLNNLLKEESNITQFKVNNLSRFFNTIKEYERENQDFNIYEYVDFLDYSIEVGESPLVDQMDLNEYDAVNILSVHGAKGLEFPVVFLSSLVSDRFPSRSRKDTIPMSEELIKEALTGLDEREEHLQEERRLFYVGATRAKEKLYLSAANFYGSAKRKKKSSIFLSEILDRDITEDFANPSVVKTNRDTEIYVPNQEDVISGDIKMEVGKRVSYSQINVYENCPKKYMYSYVLQVPSKPHASLSFGTSIHNTLRDFYTLFKRYKEGLGITQVPKKEDLIDFFEKNWVRIGYESKRHELSRKKSGIKMLSDYYERFFDIKGVPYALEQSFTVRLPDSSFVGMIDRMDLIEMTDGIPSVEIVDYKTGKLKSDSEIKKDLQLPLYSVFAQQSLGVKVLKAKYLFVEEGVEVEVEISDKRKEKAKDNVYEVIESIKQGEFTPTPSLFKCRYCDYNSICKDAIL